MAQQPPSGDQQKEEFHQQHHFLRQPAYLITMNTFVHIWRFGHMDFVAALAVIVVVYWNGNTTVTCCVVKIV
jgi:hypothetical protein